MLYKFVEFNVPNTKELNIYIKKFTQTMLSQILYLFESQGKAVFSISIYSQNRVLHFG